MLSAIVKTIPSTWVQRRLTWVTRSHWWAYWAGVGDTAILACILAIIIFLCG